MTVPWTVQQLFGWGRWLALLTGLAGGVAAVQTGHVAMVMTVAVSSGSLWSASRRLRRMEAEQRRDHGLRQELTAYALLDLGGEGLDSPDLPKAICQVVAARSSFCGAALLLTGGAGEGFRVAGSCGIDDVSVQALLRWSAGAAVAETLARAPRVGEHSALVRLERRNGQPGDGWTRLGCEEVVVMPLQKAGRVIGLLAVGARQKVVPSRTRRLAKERTGVRPELLGPIELLGLRLMQHDANELRSRRLRQRAVFATEEWQTSVVSTREPERSDGRRALDGTEGVAHVRGEVALRRLLERMPPAGYTLPERTGDRMQGFCRIRG